MAQVADPFVIDADFEDDAPAAPQRGDAGATTARAAAEDAAEAAAAPEPEQEVQASEDSRKQEQASTVTDFERERQARILRNRQALDALGVKEAAAELLDHRAADHAVVVKKPKRKDREPREKPVVQAGPVKRSRRVAVGLNFSSTI